MFNSDTRKLKKDIKNYDALFTIVGRKIADKMNEDEEFRYELNNLTYDSYLKLPKELKEKIEKLLEKNLKLPRSLKFNKKIKLLSENKFNKDIDEFLGYGERLAKRKKRLEKNHSNSIFSKMKMKIKEFFIEEEEIEEIKENNFNEAKNDVIEYPILDENDILEGEVLDGVVEEYPILTDEDLKEEPEVIETEEVIEEEKEDLREEENLPSVIAPSFDTSILPSESLKITEVKELVSKINELNASKKKLQSRLEFIISSIKQIEKETGLTYKDLNKNTVNKTYVDKYKQRRKINQMIKDTDNAIVLYSKMIEREILYKNISGESRSIDNLEKMMKLLEEINTMNVSVNEYQDKYNSYESSLIR